MSVSHMSGLRPAIRRIKDDLGETNEHSVLNGIALGRKKRDSFLRNIELVETYADRRYWHGIGHSVLHGLNDLDGGLFAGFIG